MLKLNELGFSISLLKVVDFGLANGLDMLKLLDAPAETTAWPATMSSWKVIEASSLSGRYGRGGTYFAYCYIRPGS
jgi:hypothetical protein